jgi:hypothetical protein
LRAVIFVDALLPHPGKTWFDTLPKSFSDALVATVSRGRLLPWTRWFSDAVMSALLPDPALRLRFEADAPQLPVAYALECAPFWAAPDAPAAYLRPTAYESDAKEAERRGWKIHREELTHLAMLTHPMPVSHLIDALASALCA